MMMNDFIKWNSLPRKQVKVYARSSLIILLNNFVNICSNHYIKWTGFYDDMSKYKPMIKLASLFSFFNAIITKLPLAKNNF